VALRWVMAATPPATGPLVHHSVILEFGVPSYRTSEAGGPQQKVVDDNYDKEEKRQE